MEQLIRHLRNYYPLSPQATAALTGCLREHTFSKNDYLIKKGRVCSHLYFLEEGALRGFYHLNDREITNWFGFENTFVTSFHSYTTGQPAMEYIQFMEDSRLWAIAKQDLLHLFDGFHEVERMVRIIYEKYYVQLEERFFNLQFKTANERYADLMAQAPQMLNRVPLGYISSYLGMTQETLSRVRKQHAQNGNAI